jgi:hypothetical protein
VAAEVVTAAAPDAWPPAGGLLAPGGVGGGADPPLAEPVPDPLAGSVAALAGGPAGALDPGDATLATCVAGGTAGAAVFAALVAGVAAASLPPDPINPILNAPYAAPPSKTIATTATTAARLPPPLFCAAAGTAGEAGCGAAAADGAGGWTAFGAIRVVAAADDVAAPAAIAAAPTTTVVWLPGVGTGAGVGSCVVCA